MKKRLSEQESAPESEYSQEPGVLGFDDRIYLQICDYETKEFSGLTTYHGLIRIYNSNTWPSRIFWCVVVLCCLSLFMIHCGYLLLSYHSKPTLFQITTTNPKNGIEFPDITFCPYIQIVPNKLKSWNVSMELANYLLHSYSAESVADDQELRKYENDLKLYFDEYTLSTQKNFSVHEFFENVGPTCEELEITCSFAETPIKNCCDHAVRVHTDIGYCIRFKGDTLHKRQYFAGKRYGYHFFINAKSEYREGYILPQLYTNSAIRVLVHENNKETSLLSNGYDSYPGTATQLAIDMNNITLMHRKDWGVCQNDWDPEVHGENLLQRNYTTDHCEWNCRAQNYMNTCGCIPLGLYINSTLPTCLPKQLEECEAKITEIHTACTCDKECLLMEYNMRTSSSRLEKISFRKTHVNAERLDMHSFYIFFRTVTYEHYEQQKQLQTADLLSNIAGSMGLFLGMSTVTLLEIFIYLFKSVWGTVNTERQEQFMNAMLEEAAEERAQNLLVIDEPIEDHASAPDDNLLSTRPSRRFSISTGRRESRIIIHRDSVAPPTHIVPGTGARRSIAVLNRPEHEAAGEILHSGAGRRASTINPYRHHAHRLSIQHNDETIHVAIMNQTTRRRSSINPKHFLV